MHAPTLVAAVAVLVVFAAPVVAVVWMLVGGATAHTGAAVLPRCVTEDSRDCYWDAGESGNGAGDSFVDVGGVTFYGVER